MKGSLKKRKPLRKPLSRVARGKGKNPLKIDPSRTAGLRRKFIAVLRRRFFRLKAIVYQKIAIEDALGTIENQVLKKCLDEN